jgi:UDPglucose 6-dehydrogenase
MDNGRSDNAMRIVVIGTGHVGLVTCGALASIGHAVTGLDSDKEKVATLNAGRLPFVEPGLGELIARVTAEGRLRFATEAQEAIAKADAVFICVGTPPLPSGEPDLVAMEQAAELAGRYVTDGCVIVEKSTVPAGTAERLRRVISRARPVGKGRLDIASNPEFLREGHAVRDALEPDRILIGAESEHARAVLRRVYQPLVERGYRLMETDINTAELAKHACNGYLALKISYANALARVCDLAGADVTAIADVMGADPRINRAFLDAGLGFGGSCFPKDLQAFERLSARLGYDFQLLREVMLINENAVAGIVGKIRDELWSLEGKKIALFGLAFKPGTDDVREAPALALARRLMSAGALVTGHDPEAARNAKQELPELEIASEPLDAASGADCVVVCTEWPLYRTLDLSALSSVMAYPFVVDARNIYSGREMREHGFVYRPVGRPNVDAFHAELTR